MNRIFSVSMLLAAFCITVSATTSTSLVTGVSLDTRTYNITVVSPRPYCWPEAGTYGVAKGGGIGLFASFYEDSNTAYVANGWVAEGGTPAVSDPAGSPWFSAGFYPTSLVSTVTWSWDTYYSLTLLTNGQGTVSSVPSVASKQLAGTEFTLTALPGSGWLFAGWSGDVSGGPSATSAVYVLNAPAVATASFSDDPDEDGLKNVDEWAHGADPWLADTDDDGFGDKLEVDHNWNPAVSDQWAVDHIRANGDDFGLYPSNAVLDVAVGQALFDVQGNTAHLNLQLEQSEDLKSWTDAGDPVEWTLTLDPDKKFFRVRAE